MTTALFSPLTTVLFVVTAGILGHVLGSTQLTRRHEELIGWVVEVVEDALGLRYQYDVRPSLWQRAGRWFRRDKPLAEEWAEPWPPADTPADARVAVVAITDLPERDPTTAPMRIPQPAGPTGPATQPDMKRAHRVAPPATDWAAHDAAADRDYQARQKALMDDFHRQADKIVGGRA